MNKGDVLLLAQLLRAMRDAVAQIDIAYEKKDSERLEEIKREILNLQQKVDAIL